MDLGNGAESQARERGSHENEGFGELHATTNGRAAAVALSTVVLWLLLNLPDLLSYAGA